MYLSLTIPRQCPEFDVVSQGRPLTPTCCLLSATAVRRVWQLPAFIAQPAEDAFGRRTTCRVLDQYLAGPDESSDFADVAVLDGWMLDVLRQATPANDETAKPAPAYVADDEHAELDSEGAVFIGRGIDTMEWFDDPVLCSLMMKIIVRCSYVDHDYQGITERRGTWSKSFKAWAAERRMSHAALKQALGRLRDMGEITFDMRGPRMLITCVHYDAYTAKPAVKAKSKSKGRRKNAARG